MFDSVRPAQIVGRRRVVVLPCRYVCAAALVLAWGALDRASAAASYPTRAFLAERAARRFPQPVRAGDLIGRTLLAPKEQQPVLGRVAAIVQPSQGSADVVIDVPEWLGISGRRVSVPIEAVALLGEYVALIDVTPDQLRASPDFDPKSAPEVPPDQSIDVGLVKPFH